MFRLLFLGDISGETGIACVKRLLPGLRERLSPDLVVANAENAANGLGVSGRALARLRRAGCDLFTSGNHVWDHDEVFTFIGSRDDLLRPANYPSGTPGRGHTVVRAPRTGARVLVANLLGRLFLARVDCPFQAAERILDAERGNYDLAFFDFHAEATAEKAALARFLDGRATGVFGTHTHVQTNDARVLAGGTAFITDAGMTGAEDAVIGVTAGPVLDFFRHRRYRPWGPAKGDAALNGCLVEADPATGRALSISPVIERAPKA